MQEVYQQLISLVVFSITGFIIGFLFDIFRILRKSFKTADWMTYLQDILFWLLTGLIILYSIFKFNYGEIRIYVFLGIFLGIFLYMLTISRCFIKYSVIIINTIKKVFSYPINFIKVKLIQSICSFLKKILFNDKKILGSKFFHKFCKKK